MNRRSFIHGCTVVGVALGLPSRDTVGDSQGQTRHSVRSKSPSPSGIAKVPPPGEVAAISGPGTDAPNTMSKVMYLTTAGGASGSGGNYFSIWCSGVHAPDDGPYGSMVFSNGGDGDYWGNEVYKFSIATRTWSRECERSTGISGAVGDPNFDAAWASTFPHQARHRLSLEFRTVTIRWSICLRISVAAPKARSYSRRELSYTQFGTLNTLTYSTWPLRRGGEVPRHPE